MGNDDVIGARHVEAQRLRALLRDSAVRRKERAYVLEGPRLVADAIRREADIETIYVALGTRKAFPELMATAHDAEIRICELKDGVLEKLGTTRTPQPVLAIVPMPDEPAALSGNAPVLVLVGVSDPGNLGTLLRTAEASGAEAVICCGDTVDPFNPKVVRSSAGSILSVPVLQFPDPCAALDGLAAQGRRRIGTSSFGERSYGEADLRGGVAIVLGSEAHGLPADVRAHIDEWVTIPMAGETESINLAVAGSVLCFEAARQRSQEI